jgi:hypothetical protein
VVLVAEAYRLAKGIVDGAIDWIAGIQALCRLLSPIDDDAPVAPEALRAKELADLPEMDRQKVRVIREGDRATILLPPPHADRQRKVIYWPVHVMHFAGGRWARPRRRSGGCDDAGWLARRCTSFDNPTLRRETIERMIEDLGGTDSITVQQELYAQFLSGAGAVFRRLADTAVLSPAAPVDDQDYVLGVDLARITDYAVPNVLDLSTEPVHQVHVDRFHRMGWAVQIDQLSAVVRHFRPRVVFITSNWAFGQAPPSVTGGGTQVDIRYVDLGSQPGILYRLPAPAGSVCGGSANMPLREWAVEARGGRDRPPPALPSAAGARGGHLQAVIACTTSRAGGPSLSAIRPLSGSRMVAGGPAGSSVTLYA